MNATPAPIAPPRRAPIQRPPATSGLPQTGLLLDPDAMAPRLERLLVRSAPIERLRVRHVELQPGLACTVGYEATVAGTRHTVAVRCDPRGDARGLAGSRAAEALAAAADARTPARRALTFDASIPALVQWFPADVELPLLAAPGALRRLAGPAGAGAQPQLLGHRPGHRAVVRVGDAVLKLYAADAGVQAGLRGLLFSGRLAGVGPVPAVRGCFERLRVTVQGAVDGTPVERERAVELAPRAGALLRALHAAPADDLPATTPERQLAAAARSAALVSAVAPALAGRTARLLDALRHAAPAVGATVAAHGDFNVSQLLDAGGALSLVDFDEACQAATGLDVAAYATNVVSGRPGDLEHADRVLAALLDGYGERPADLSWHLATELLRRSASPFRRFKRDWPERTDALVAAAAEVLGR
jgi:hypothetical protein